MAEQQRKTKDKSPNWGQEIVDNLNRNVLAEQQEMQSPEYQAMAQARRSENLRLRKLGLPEYESMATFRKANQLKKRHHLQFTLYDRIADFWDRIRDTLGDFAAIILFPFVIFISLFAMYLIAKAFTWFMAQIYYVL